MYYVLVKNGFEYDDEGYRSNSYGDPNYCKLEKVYISKKEAEIACQELNRKHFKHTYPFEYDPYRWGSQKPLDPKYDIDYASVAKDASDAEVDEFMAAFPELRFWQVVEVE